MSVSNVGGVSVPNALAPLFNRSTRSTNGPVDQRFTPFSYTRPTPGGPKLHTRIKCPRVIPASFWSSFEEEPKPEPEMPQTVHLQYNSPMGLYSKESAVEQFEQQIGESPGNLPAADKHFDPSKSATLKYLKEGEKDGFGDNFFEKVAQAEAPNVPNQSEPGWARTAREKSERARSKTPADPGYRPAYSPAPANHPVHYENAREHSEKNKVFTHNVNDFGRSYYDAAHDLQRYRRSHSAGRELSNRGYELGGMDYTQGINVDHGIDYQYYEEPQRKPQPPKQPPGYELGGSDFYKGHVSGNNNYRGHGPDPPRLRPKYTADPHDPCNVAVAPNIEAVDGNLLVGDTLSNQKIRHEVRHIDQSTFGTSFAPPGGFKQDHVTVHRAPEPPKPTVYSLSANKNLARSASVPRSSAPPTQHNVWNTSQYETDKETYITEPNWRRNVDQRRLAWERRAFDTEQRLSRPYSEKVAPGVPPSWHAVAENKHQQWQQQSDNLNMQNSTGNYNQSYDSQHTYQQSQPASQVYNYTTTTTTNTTSGQPSQQYFNQSYDDSHTNAQRLLNTGFNSNQVDYVLSHKDRYNEGPHYQPPIVNSSAQNAQNNSSSSYNQYSSSSTQAIPLGGVPHHTSSNYSTETRTVGNAPNYNSSNQQQNYHSSSYNSTTSQNKAIPVSNYQAGTFNEVCKTYHSPAPVVVQNSQHYQKNEEESTEVRESRSQSVPAFHTESYQEDQRSEKSVTTIGDISLPPLQAYDQNYESSNFNKNLRTQTTTTTTTTHQPQPVANNYTSNYHSTLQTTQQQQQQPRTIALPNPQNHSSSYHTETHSSTGPVMMHSPGGQSFKSTEFSSSRYNKEETKTTTTQQPQPVFQTSNLPITRNTTYNYSQNSSSSAPRQVQQPASYQYENYLSSKKEESRREETSRPVSQLSQYSESRNYKRNYEEKTETTTVPAGGVSNNVTYKDLSNAKSVDDVFNKKTEMNESLPFGSISNTHNNTEGGYRDASGHDVSYKRETQTSADPGRETALLKEEEKRVVETPLEPGVISRHVTTKYYKKKTVTDTTTSTAPA